MDDAIALPGGPNISDLSYEQSRDALVAVVAQLERGGTSLEQALALWERGEALAARCQEWLDAARARITAASTAEASAAEASAAPD